MTTRTMMTFGGLASGIALGIAMIAPSASAAPVAGTLAGTAWNGTVSFVSGANTGIVEQGSFYYHADGTLDETTDGAVGNFTGTGTWVQGLPAITPCAQLLGGVLSSHAQSVRMPSLTAPNRLFTSHFVEPVAGTNVQVIVDECGIIAPNSMTYVAYGHGQPYTVDNGQLTPIPHAGGDTISRMSRQ